MSAALVIVFVALGDGDDPSTRAMTRTTQQVLGEKSVVLVREVPHMPDDTEASKLATSAHATVVELEWSPDRRAAKLRVRAAPGTWTERAVTFQTTDPPSERGRLLAYAVATMVPPETETAPETTPEPQPPPKVQSPPKVQPPPQTTPSTKPPVVITNAPFFGWLGVTLERANDATIERRAYGVSVYAARIPNHFGFGVSLGARTGDVDVADASTTTLHAGIGPVFALQLSRFVGLSASAEIDGVYVRLDRPATGHDGRMLPAFSAALHTALGTERAAGILGVGFEQMLGKTDVFVGDAHIGALPRTRALLQIGVRLRF